MLPPIDGEDNSGSRRSFHSSVLSSTKESVLRSLLGILSGGLDGAGRMFGISDGDGGGNT